MQLRIPDFITGKNSRVILMMAILFALGINGINFGFTMGQGGLHFIFSSVISIVCFWVVLRACDAIGKFFKHRFPQDRDVIPRLSLVILFYLIAILLFLVALFNLFESIPFFDYRYNRTAFAWSYFSLGILAIFLTFLREGITRYNEWQQYRLETEELHRAYTRSQLYALKSQVNPHFLFNSLNALSCLIQDDEARAEKFLDEMSKVYRYMLRHDDERLVTLETELRFLASYIHLLEARYSDSLQINISINPDDQQKWLAPLTLQVIIENVFTQNALGKLHPLLIDIRSEDTGSIRISHPLRPKTITGNMDFNEGLDNLRRKYELLSLPLDVRDISGEQRQIFVPLIAQPIEQPQ